MNTATDNLIHQQMKFSHGQFRRFRLVKLSQALFNFIDHTCVQLCNCANIKVKILGKSKPQTKID